MAMKKTAQFLGMILSDNRRSDYSTFSIDEYTDEANGVKCYTAILPGYRELVQLPEVKAKRYMETFIEVDHPLPVPEIEGKNIRKPNKLPKDKLEREVVGDTIR